MTYQQVHGSIAGRIAPVVPARWLLRAKALKHYWLGAPEIRLLKTLVHPARNSLDIGAAEGMYTYFLSRLCAHVDAYEPNPALYDALSAAAPVNATVHNMALSDEEGERTLWIPVAEGGGIPWRGSLEDLAPRNICVQMAVRTKRLDDMGHKNVGFIKIDVEGHEAAVLRGASRLIEENAPTLLVEIEQRHLRVDIREVFSLVTRMGYDGFFLYERVLYNLDQFDVERHQRRYVSTPESPQYINNFVFFPQRRQ